MMKQLSLCILALFLTAQFAAGEPPIVAGLEKALADHAVTGTRQGVVVRRLSDGKELFSSRGRELFRIASNTKLFTTAAALWTLGPTYEFQTQVIANGEIRDGVLQGDLVVVGGGDPNLSGRLYGDVMTAPRAMAAAAVQAGIRSISGDLVMDDRLFDRTYRAPDWPEEESLWWYCAPISALSFNDNCADITVKGAAKAGDPARITVSPGFPCVKIVNRCETCAPKRAQGVHFARDDGGVIVVSGRIRIGTTRTESIAVETPALFLAAAVRDQLVAAGVRVIGRDRLVHGDEKARSEARLLLVWRSGLADAVRTANRRSQNFFAEQILKTLGAAQGGLGTFESGTQAVKAFLSAAKFPDDTVQLEDGSGLSPDNRATPQAVAALLEAMYRSDLREIFYDSLAVSGDSETTLRSHMTDPALAGKIRAKTGTIKSRGIRALSGYAEGRGGEVYAFSILSNGFSAGRLARVMDAEEALCRVLVQTGEKNGG